MKTSFNVEIVRSGFVNSKLSKTFAVGLKVPYHFRLSITSGATFNSLAKCLQFFTALVIYISNLLVIFSTASGLSFMKAENKDSKRKGKMYIMIKLLRLYSLVTLRDLLWKKTQEFFMNLQNLKKKDIDIYISNHLWIACYPIYRFRCSTYSYFDSSMHDSLLVNICTNNKLL